jgi:hypoxanthine phosphoribosyltransferase
VPIFLISQETFSAAKIMETVSIQDKKFVLSIPAPDIRQRVKTLAEEMNKELNSHEVVFVGVLNGVFLFAAELLQKISFPCRITFMKLASYEKTASTGEVRHLIGLNEDLKGKTVVVLEDIIDTGQTLGVIMEQIKEYKPAEVRIATLLLKPDVYSNKFPIDYVGFRIPNEFVIGHGLDYDGYGRNLESIYTIIQS